MQKRVFLFLILILVLAGFVSAVCYNGAGLGEDCSYFPDTCQRAWTPGADGTHAFEYCKSSTQCELVDGQCPGFCDTDFGGQCSPTRTTGTCVSTCQGETCCIKDKDCDFLSQTKIELSDNPGYTSCGWDDSTSSQPYYYCRQPSCEPKYIGEWNTVFSICQKSSGACSTNTDCQEGESCVQYTPGTDGFSNRQLPPGKSGICEQCSLVCQTCPAGTVEIICTDNDKCQRQYCLQDEDNDKYPVQMPGPVTECNKEFDCNDDPNYKFQTSEKMWDKIDFDPNECQEITNFDKDNDGITADQINPGEKQVYFGENCKVAKPFPDTNCNSPPEIKLIFIRKDEKDNNEYYSEDSILFRGEKLYVYASIYDLDEPKTGGIKVDFLLTKRYYEKGEEKIKYQEKVVDCKYNLETANNLFPEWKCEWSTEIDVDDAIIYVEAIPIDSRGEKGEIVTSNSFKIPGYVDIVFYEEGTKDPLAIDPTSLTLLNHNSPPFFYIIKPIEISKARIDNILELNSFPSFLANYFLNDIANFFRNQVEKFVYPGFDPGKDRIVIISSTIMNRVSKTDLGSTMKNGWWIYLRAGGNPVVYTHERLHTGSFADNTKGLVDENSYWVWWLSGAGPNPWPECCTKKTPCPDNECPTREGCVRCEKYGSKCVFSSEDTEANCLPYFSPIIDCMNEQGLCMKNCYNLQPSNSQEEDSKCEEKKGSGWSCCMMEKCENTDSSCPDAGTYFTYGSCVDCTKIGQDWKCTKLASFYKCIYSPTTEIESSPICGTSSSCPGFPYLNTNTKDDDTPGKPPYGPLFSIMSAFSLYKIAIPCETGVPYRYPCDQPQLSPLTGNLVSEQDTQEAFNLSVQKVFVVYLKMFRDGKAKIESVNVDEMIPSNNFYLNEADENVWFVKILSEEKKELSAGKISTGFYIFDLNIELSESREYIKLPYLADAKFIEIYYQGNKVAEAEINNQQFCNNDNICNNFESYSSCSDCKESDLDGVCSQVYNQTNGICDPDCLFDLDCPQQYQKIADLNQDGQISFAELFSTLKKFDKQEINSAQILRAIREWLSS